MVSASPTRRRLLAAAGFSVGFAGCLTDVGSEPPELATPEAVPDDDWSRPAWRPADGAPTEDDVDATPAVSGLEIPWDLAFAGDHAFVTERDGGIRRFDADEVRDGQGVSAEDGDVILRGTDLPNRAAPGEGGTLGIDVHPDFPDRSELFVYYTADDGDTTNRVVRYDLESAALEPVLEGIPGGTIHNGGRIAFGPAGFLWVTTGDANDPPLAQDPGASAGAILRTTPDGEPHPENPDWGDDGDSRTYALGHRNPQGIDFTPQGAPLVGEHGPSARDELSILRPGGNYGWDVVRGGPGDPEYESYAAFEDATPPIVNTGPDTTWAPSGLAFYDDGAIEPWENHALVAGLALNTLVAVALIPEGGSANREGDPEDGAGVRYDADWFDDRFTATAYSLFDGEYGRLRRVETGPDGSVYLLTSNRDGRAGGDFPRERDDRIVRLDPA